MGGRGGGREGGWVGGPGEVTRNGNRSPASPHTAPGRRCGGLGG